MAEREEPLPSERVDAFEEEAEALGRRLEQLGTSRDRLFAAEPRERREQELDAGLASLLMRLGFDDPIASAYRKLMRADKSVLGSLGEAELGEENDDAIDAAEGEWSERYSAFMEEAQKRLGSRLGPERASREDGVATEGRLARIKRLAYDGPYRTDK